MELDFGWVRLKLYWASRRRFSAIDVIFEEYLLSILNVSENNENAISCFLQFCKKSQ